MAREEAISIMNVIVHMLEEKYDTDRVEEVVDMAISDMKRVEELEAENKRLKDGIEKVKAEIDRLKECQCPFADEYANGVHDGFGDALKVIKEYLGE